MGRKSSPELLHALQMHGEQEREWRREVLERLKRVEANQDTTQAQLAQLGIDQLAGARKAGARSGATVAALVIAVAGVLTAVLRSGAVESVVQALQ